MTEGKYPNPPPLVQLFRAKRLDDCRGMNLLQEGPELFISDNCVWPRDVAPCDQAAVIARAGHKPWRRDKP